MRNLLPTSLLTISLLWLTAGTARAHFLLLRPSADVIETDGPRTLQLDIRFTHPMEQGPVMEMAMPRQFGMLAGGKRVDLLKELKPRKLDGRTAYTAALRPTAPGDCVLFVEPAPYWEPAERKMIVHYTKVVVNAFGAQRGWDAMVGFPVEIEPLVRPYGLWTGNAFRGIVRRDGKPAPFATIEVEYCNDGGRVRVPNDAFVTQTIKADANGTFSYTMPRAGWWGFAALVAGDKRLKAPDGKPADVELGGLMWVRTVDMESK
jgi:cobalt/nickel transport protein